MRTFLAVVVMAMIAAVATAVTVPGTDLYVPSVGHGLGSPVNGVTPQWRADLWIFNPSSRVANVSVALLLRDQANPNPIAVPRTVNPGETLFIEDVVLDLFGRDNTYGALRVTSDVPVVVTGSSYDANVTVEAKQRGTGSAGQFFSALPADTAVGTNEFVDLPGLDQDGASTDGIWRSNLALVETSGNPVTLDIKRLDASGATVTSIPYSLGAREARQINLVLTTIGGGPARNQRVRVTVTGGQGRVLASGSRIDNRTGDPSTVDMAGASRTGVYVCKLDKTTFDTPLTLTVANNTVTSMDATILITDEDAGASCQGELLRLAQALDPAVVLEGGTFAFMVGGNAGALTVSLQVAGTIGPTGTVSGQVTTTVSGAGECSGTKAWPLVGARAAN